ncbi:MULTISPECIES: hypothetical protein [unclassified Streptomyces]|uniref:hypothetical protein n=1 Tax=unclassified Streptomyces TaxID=2593676 RepID=UPI002256F2C9|nr:MULTISPECIES: hypothetical protein [unclassified Streptomyces]MCX5336162.1 hypothetical protein [Streptomyces sp. NBC_00140]MCX5366883.1 hypothetical protein [Streptomyces sp. NBC_00124]
MDAKHAKDAAATGAKAANLARAAVAGLPVLPGFMLVPADRAPWAATGEDEGLELRCRRCGSSRFGQGAETTDCRA